MSVIVSVYKRRDKTDCSNYLHKSFLIVYSNVFKIMLKSAPFAVKVVGDCQCGFRCSRWSADVYPEFTSVILWSALWHIHRLFKWDLDRVCVIPSPLNFQCPLATLRSSSSGLCLHPHFPGTYILPSISPSVTYFIRQVQSRIWPVQLVCPLFIVCKIFLSSVILFKPPHFSHNQSNWLSPSFFQHQISKLPRDLWSTFWSVLSFCTLHNYAPNVALY
jgi:hypothetical protein